MVSLVAQQSRHDLKYPARFRRDEGGWSSLNSADALLKVDVYKHHGAPRALERPGNNTQLGLAGES